jgi:mono/diheme cytochrome c family protein
MATRGRASWAAMGIGGFAVLLGATVGPQRSVSYQKDIQPIFRAHCMPCHSARQSAGGLTLESFAGAVRAVSKGQPDQSVLIERLLGKGGLPQMPMGFKPLANEDIQKIRAWIEQGANDSDSVSKHWAFVPPKRPPVPKFNTWTRNPIDAFILARLQKEGLTPSAEADRTILIRRLSLDLTGIPPTPEEVDSFLAEKSPGTYEKLVDRLLSSPHYGERMAWAWLDAARYADSNGFQQDGDTHQYVWRDWVVRALNANMPFDQFTIEQLAGDLLPEPNLAQLIATGFNRNHMLNGEGGAIAEEQRNVILYDRVDTTATAWLGLTMACARCHDHKYDPIPQRDFYRFMAYFNRVPETGVPAGGGQYRIADPWVYSGDGFQLKEFTALRKALQLQEVRLRGLAKDSEEAKTELRTREAWEARLNKLRAAMPRVMVMSDRQPRKTFVQNRGNYTEPMEEVQPGTPTALPRIGAKPDRLGLAKWIVSPQNPLTARVQVNRFWQHFFGRGLVRTEENFGIKGELATHPELLDWLAVDFRESGWNVKRLHKRIVMSATYRQASKVTPELLKKDPANRLYARASRFRLPSPILRDLALATSGLLNPKMGGKPVYPYQPAGIWDGLAITLERDFTYPQSKGEDNHRRSLYTFWRRTAAPGNMFDSASRQICTVKIGLTSTPLHALTMLNDVTWVEAGRGLAQSILNIKGDEARLKEAFRRVCARRPNLKELQVLTRALERSRKEFRSDPKAADAFLKQGDAPLPIQYDPVELASLASVCLAIYNLDEAMTRE